MSERINPSEHPIGLAWTILRRMVYPWADALVVQTQTALPWAKKVVLGRKRAHVIPNPVRDMQAFRRLSETAAVATNTIVAIGRLAPQKGFDTLLHAFARVAPAAPAWNLVILGDGEERQRLEALISSLGIAGRVTLPGWHPEPGEVLRTAGLFVMTSRYEGFPNALVEAMACGVPVVTTAWAGSNEIIRHEVDGLLVPGGVDQVADGISRAIADAGMRRRLGTNALAVADRYRVNSIIEQWDALVAQRCQPIASLRFYF